PRRRRRCPARPEDTGPVDEGSPGVSPGRSSAKVHRLFMSQSIRRLEARLRTSRPRRLAATGLSLLGVLAFQAAWAPPAPAAHPVRVRAPAVQPFRVPGPLFGVCPVDPPHHYVDDFGDARWVGGFHRHQGIDIIAPRGTRIRAPFAGMTRVSESWAGGLQVY